MKLIITTNVWISEYDAHDFRDGHTLLKSDDYWTVTEEIDFDPELTTIKIEA